MTALYQAKLDGDKPNQPVVIPIWRNEESPWLNQFAVGSKFAMGQLSAEFLKTAEHTAYKISLIKLMGETHLDLRGSALLKKMQSDDPKLINPDYIEGAIETHIEQGSELEKNDNSLGIVTAIRGNVRFPDMIDFIGEEGHSGTTPQKERQSALIAASKFIVQLDLAFENYAKNGLDIVWDFPQGESVNGKPTTISGHFRLRPEVRSTDPDILKNAQDHFKKVAEGIETFTGIQVEMNRMNIQQPVEMSSFIHQSLLSNAQSLGVSARSMPSGAGHDVQILTQGGINGGLIFIRHGNNGVSHLPDEILGRDKNDNPFSVNSDFANACDLNRLFLLGTKGEKEVLPVSFEKDLQQRGARLL